MLLAIFDNPNYIDRYTFVSDNIQNGLYDMLGTSETGAGISQWSQGQYNPSSKNRHLGKPVKWESLSPELKEHVIARMGE